MSDMLRSKVIRIASELPKGDETRRKLLALVKEGARLDLGQQVMSRGVAARARRDPAFAVFILESFKRQARGDWGDTKGEDRRMNDRALKNGDDRVFSVFLAADGTKIWVITEWDRSVTTALFPSEY